MRVFMEKENGAADFCLFAGLPDSRQTAPPLIGSL
jgi:hypothetical protein